MAPQLLTCSVLGERVPLFRGQSSEYRAGVTFGGLWNNPVPSVELLPITFITLRSFRKRRRPNSSSSGGVRPWRWRLVNETQATHLLTSQVNETDSPDLAQWLLFWSPATAAAAFVVIGRISVVLPVTVHRQCSPILDHLRSGPAFRTFWELSSQ